MQNSEFTGKTYKLAGPYGTSYLLKAVNGTRGNIEDPVGVLVSQHPSDHPAFKDAEDLGSDSHAFLKLLDPKLMAAKFMDYAAIVGDGYDGEGLMKDAVRECMVDSFEDSQRSYEV